MRKPPGLPSTTPTLEDVARRAGVSTATVSRCLNTPERVLDETRVRVIAAVEALGYSPNFGARALAAKRTNTIGAVIPTMENDIFARGIQAFQEELGRHGQTLLVASSGYDADLEEAQIRTLVARGADGLLLIGFDRRAEIYRFLETQSVPVLVTWAYGEGTTPLSIGFDNRAAMRGLGAAAIAQGHRRIGMISAPQAGNDRAAERVAGLREAMAAGGLDPDGLQLVETPYGIQTGAVACRELMAAEPRPTVLLCGNDVLAVGAMRAALDLGLSVPGDVSITGFDDMDLATVANPALTSVAVPHAEMGRRAAAMLVRMVAGDGPDHSVQLATHLRLRASLAPPAGSEGPPT